MAIQRQRRNNAYGFPQAYKGMFPDPLILTTAPTERDGGELGQIAVVPSADSAYVLTSTDNGVNTWTSIDTSVADTVASLTVQDGPVTFEYPPFDTTAGVVINDASGVLSSSAGNDGQVLIGSTGAAPGWYNLTPGTGISITNASGSITIASGGGTGLAWSSTGSATLTAASNHGYALTGLNPIVTLPASPSLGDVVAIVQNNTGAGATITLKPDGADALYWNGQSQPAGGIISTSLTGGTGESDQLGCYIEVVAISIARWTVRSINGNFIAAS